ncbi:hypothetical protein C8P66_10763 [Humitalea rosea]|uniref:Uncharacterized protein n=1 Tax=Humitalea rosea TaxID=990373 RepID=A0A2W7IMF8_9PROT|nr:hypothetical protein [Humitalea rosea]PZW47025.1 hypothetical protein C8P66_10763 [Humitalea rosea]
MTMTDSAVRGRFAELVKLHLQGRRFLDREQETKLLEDAVTRYSLSLEEAQATIRTSAEALGVVLARELDRPTVQLLKTLGDRQGRVARDDFRKVVAFYRARTGAALTEADGQKRVKRLMEENEIAPRRQGRIVPTRRWYRAIEA